MQQYVDMDGVNVRSLENLGSSVDHPYFEFEGHEIALHDPPHLLKCFRNLFMKYDVKLPIPVQSTTTTTTTATGNSNCYNNNTRDIFTHGHLIPN